MTPQKYRRAARLISTTRLEVFEGFEAFDTERVG